MLNQVWIKVKLNYLTMDQSSAESVEHKWCIKTYNNRKTFSLSVQLNATIKWQKPPLRPTEKIQGHRESDAFLDFRLLLR